MKENNTISSKLNKKKMKVLRFEPAVFKSNHMLTELLLFFEIIIENVN